MTSDFPASSEAIVLSLSAIVPWLLMMRYATSRLPLPLPSPFAAVTPERYASPHHLLHQVLASFRFTAQQRGVMLTSGLSRDVPNALHGDFDGFTECLRHMVSSALIRTARGRIHVQMEATPSAGGSQVKLLVSISDTSESMPHVQLRNLFHSTPGWRNVAKIARRAGGYAWTGCNPGGGAVAGFTVSMSALCQGPSPESGNPPAIAYAGIGRFAD